MDSFFSSLPLPSPFPPLVWSVDSPVLPGFTASRISLAQPNLQIPYLIPFQHFLSSNPVRHPVPVSVFQRSSVPASQASTIQPSNQPNQADSQLVSQPASRQSPVARVTRGRSLSVPSLITTRQASERKTQPVRSRRKHSTRLTVLDLDYSVRP